MKKLIIIILALINFVKLSAQKEKIFVSDPQTKPVVSICLFNIAYKGIKNKLEIAVPSISVDKLIVTTDNGIVFGSGGVYYFIPEQGNMANIFIASFSEKDTTYYSPYKIRILAIPSPVANFCGIKNNGTVSKSELLQSKGISLGFETFEGIAILKNMKFCMKLKSKKNNQIFISKDEKLTEEMLLAIKNSKSGDKILLYNITVEMEDGTDRILNEIEITVK